MIMGIQHYLVNGNISFEQYWECKQGDSVLVLDQDQPDSTYSLYMSFCPDAFYPFWSRYQAINYWDEQLVRKCCFNSENYQAV
jgi:hypothetical protein